jgi:hypothetical protein
MPHQLYKSSYYYPPLYPLNYSTTQVLPQGKNSIVTKAHNHSYRYLREAAHHHLFLSTTSTGVICFCNGRILLQCAIPIPLQSTYRPAQFPDLEHYSVALYRCTNKASHTLVHCPRHLSHPPASFSTTKNHAWCVLLHCQFCDSFWAICSLCTNVRSRMTITKPSAIDTTWQERTVNSQSG